MSDPYFQQLFAERIGGSQYGKGTEIYKLRRSSEPSERRWRTIPSGH